LPKRTSLHSHDLRVAVPEMSLLSRVTPMIKTTGGGLAFMGLSRPKGIVVLVAFMVVALIVRMRRDQDADAQPPATPVAAEYVPEPAFASAPAAPPMPAPPMPAPPTAWTSQVRFSLAHGAHPSRPTS
tara:strand:+ start:601 stop:984 length:384 start_codon:yes stop_codon:yes gene_type:complete